jgi:hypothetical protein
MKRLAAPVAGALLVLGVGIARAGDKKLEGYLEVDTT